MWDFFGLIGLAGIGSAKKLHDIWVDADQKVQAEREKDNPTPKIDLVRQEELYKMFFLGHDIDGSEICDEYSKDIEKRKKEAMRRTAIRMAREGLEYSGRSEFWCIRDTVFDQTNHVIDDPTEEERSISRDLYKEDYDKARELFMEEVREKRAKEKETEKWTGMSNSVGDIIIRIFGYIGLLLIASPLILIIWFFLYMCVHSA